METCLRRASLPSFSHDLTCAVHDASLGSGLMARSPGYVVPKPTTSYYMPALVVISQTSLVLLILMENNCYQQWWWQFRGSCH
ncbi:hypothetical protein HDV57DRAFT_370301 [Trichoderma longibrachiatum]|uniref:Uncharacterized protein n=1 Tax=Trichoderma longibrachiatum ATCC 18648 TaxID=983965 RepID=A0A2T4BXL8_TRILO|nr:hypothetical protein M440DRAFT_127424 [Trichoderma longibrachiatum ATCC 18648]